MFYYPHIKLIFQLYSQERTGLLVWCTFLMFVVFIPIVCSEMLSVRFLRPHLSSCRVVPLYWLTLEYLSLLMLQLSIIQKTLVVSLEKAIMYYALGTQKNSSCREVPTNSVPAGADPNQFKTLTNTN